jgi:hypothetical protein
MITSVIGKPTPNAPPIIKANAESKFASHCTLRRAMPLLRLIPNGHRPSSRMNDKKAAVPDRIADVFESRPEPEQAESVWLREG